MTGHQAETLAALWLRLHGMRIITRNFRSRGGEIDLIGRHWGTLVFVEVKFRQSTAYGAPVEFINPAKQRRIRHTAATFLAANIRYANYPTRFDAVAISRGNYLHRAIPRVQWTRNAFYDEFF